MQSESQKSLRRHIICTRIRTLKNNKSIKFLLVAGAGGIVLVIALAVMMIVKR